MSQIAFSTTGRNHSEYCLQCVTCLWHAQLLDHIVITRCLSDTDRFSHHSAKIALIDVSVKNMSGWLLQRN